MYHWIRDEFNNLLCLETGAYIELVISRDEYILKYWADKEEGQVIFSGSQKEMEKRLTSLAIIIEARVP